MPKQQNIQLRFENTYVLGLDRYYTIAEKYQQTKISLLSEYLKSVCTVRLLISLLNPKPISLPRTYQSVALDDSRPLSPRPLLSLCAPVMGKTDRQ